jgi:hypothetical protein
LQIFGSFPRQEHLAVGAPVLHQFTNQLPVSLFEGAITFSVFLTNLNALEIVKKTFKTF